MNKHVFYLIIGFFFCHSLFAQTNDSTGIVVHKSDRLDQMMKKQFTGATNKPVGATSQSSKLTNYKVKRSGYRILVLNTNDRDLTYKTKGQLLGRYPNQQLYMVYQAPFFKLKMGDFVSRKEAENFRTEISKTIPKGVFIVREMVFVKVEGQESAN